ncbi:MAG: hypothetical protein ACTHKP_07970 [Nitrososphaeraceae archaeon]|jgi:hypothetical protein
MIRGNKLVVIILMGVLLSSAVAGAISFYNRSPNITNDNNNIPLINARLNSVVNFCLKSLPKGYAACDSQLSPAVSKICAEHAGQPIDACRDGKVDQYYRIRSTEIAKNSTILTGGSKNKTNTTTS